MKCLAVNTATTTLSLAIVDDGKVLYTYETGETRDQGNLLIGHIQEGLKKCGLGFADLDVMGVVTGPGSFTGIRVGLATLRGLALAAGKPLIGLTSFDMFAAPAVGTLNIVAVQSLREELYFAVLDEEALPLIPCRNVAPDVFVAQLREELPGEYPLRLSGDAAGSLVTLLPGAVVIEKVGDAVDAARITLQRFSQGGNFVAPTPYYLREADVTISSKPGRTVKN